MTYPVKIVGCVVDVHNLTMYKADGDTIVIPQGDPRVRDLVAALVPAFENGGPQFYMLGADDLADRNHFAESEKKMSGTVRFFKMLKSKAKELLEKFIEPVEPLELGTKKEEVMVHTVTDPETGETAPLVPMPEPVRLLPPEEERPLTKSAQAVAEIMQQATPSSSPNFSVPDVQGEEETTVLAVLEDNTVIPGCEALVNQAQAVSEGISSSTAMQNFLRRAGSIKRGHSVEDLLKFIQKGELPLADDGSVLVYKLLNSTNEEGVFVDCHSGNVKQRVGSMVHMQEKMVDSDRRQDCSNGLHVARRDYLRSFSGNVCVLAKLAPEDVIAVPQYDARKLRTKAYHIIARLSDADRSRVKNNQPMQDQVLLGNAIAGNHVGILEYVEITKSSGGGLKVTPVDGAVVNVPVLDESLSGSSLDHLSTEEFDPERNSVDARDLALKVAKPVPAPVAEGPDGADEAYFREPAVEEARLVSAVVPNSTKRPVELLVERYLDTEITELDRYHAAEALLAYKKQCKKSWTALGVDIKVWEPATQLVSAGSPIVAIPVKSVLEGNNDGLPAKPVKVKKAAPAKKTPAKTKPVAAASKVMAVKADPVKPVKEKKMTQQEGMAKLVEIYNRNPDKTNAREIFNFKQKAKKSWEVLGVTDKAFQKKITERAKL